MKKEITTSLKSILLKCISENTLEPLFPFVKRQSKPSRLAIGVIIQNYKTIPPAQDSKYDYDIEFFIGDAKITSLVPMSDKKMGDYFTECSLKKESLDKNRFFSLPPKEEIKEDNYSISIDKMPDTNGSE